MSRRGGLCFTVALSLAVVSPALLALGGVNTGDISILQWWFFGIPERLESVLGTSRDVRLTVYLACYTFQYFALMYLVTTALHEIRKPRGIEARKAFDAAVSRFHEH